MIEQREAFVREAGVWMKFLAVECDFCGRREPSVGLGEHGEVAEQLSGEGWTAAWLDRFQVCPDCRERMTSNTDRPIRRGYS